MTQQEIEQLLGPTRRSGIHHQDALRVIVQGVRTTQEELDEAMGRPEAGEAGQRHRHGHDAVADIEGQLSPPRHVPTAWIYVVAAVVFAWVLLDQLPRPVQLMGGLLIQDRRNRQKFGFRLRPMWAVVTLGVVGCIAVIGAVWVMNSYYLPENVARQVAEQQGLAWPEGVPNITPPRPF